MSNVRTSLLGYLAGVLIVFTPWAVPLRAGQNYPYNATIKNSTTVRCGPDDAYYPCQKLPAGSAVEVHAITENGFLAIRPPAGSSSWVDAADLSIDNSTVGHVIRRGTVSWIGSQLTHPQNHNWQIQLQQGEQLRLLEKRTMQIHSDLPSATYYRVTPPANEFRWIPATDVATSSVAQAGGTRWIDSEVRPASAAVPVPKENVTAPIQSKGWRNRHGQKAPRVAALDGSPDPVELPRTMGQQLRAQASQQIVLLDTELSELMAGRSEARHIEVLNSSLQQLLLQGLDQPLRQRVEVLLDRIDKYRQVQQGQLLEPGAQKSAETAIYDAAGWLMKVHTSTQRAPPYAILDDNGRVLEFVSPAPGLNLHRYLKKRVGIFGYQSYLPSLKTPHITVYRIVDLARHE